MIQYMSKIQVKYFGPIREGVSQNGFVEFSGTTIFIGDQATGKSSLAKLISTITWIEKAIYKKELLIKEVATYHRFQKKHCAYQGIDSYFQENTFIHYIGDHIDLLYENGNVSITVHEHGYDTFLPPKIMYVPAERNFLSVVDAPERLKNLPAPLYTFLDEFEIAKRQYKGIVSLPVAFVDFEYQKQSKTSYIRGEDYRVKLSKASSGMQSLIPLFLVSKNLAENIGKDEKEGVKKVSLKQEHEIKKEITQILRNEGLNDDLRSILIKNLESIYKNLAFINIVEEPEQNLYPESQKNLLYELFRFKNIRQGNKLLITTHSPYILNFTSIAVKAKAVSDKLVKSGLLTEELTNSFKGIIPLDSVLDQESLYIYEFFPNGHIHCLESYNGIPTDENHLNNILQQTNHLFDRLLELEEAYDI